MLILLSLGGELADEKDSTGNPLNPEEFHELYYDTIDEIEQVEKEISSRQPSWMDQLIGLDTSIRDRKAHQQLIQEITSHKWNKYGSSATDYLTTIYSSP